MRNLGVPGVTIAPANTTNQIIKKPDEVSDKFRARFSGDERGSVMTFSQPTEIKVLSWNPQQMDLKALRRIPEERVSAVLGDNIDTDMIYPGRYLNITDREKTAEHLFELAYPELRASLEAGDIIVAGRNFGCGSSREQAAAALKFAGVGAVIAGSFARIFFRNAINLGLPAVVAPQASLACVAGDELELDLVAGEIRNVSPWQGGGPEGAPPPAQEACSTGASIGHELSPESRVVEAAALDPRAVELIAAGGLIPYLKRKYAA